ncbi:helix-turn-helix domain-containing protein [Streptomyces halstedii]|uniref:helix-turn-helix domain-containing protein n=1 Tax=Streptomyces TaxID=1883 RepID=UPI0004BD7741|nr:MULTISPECIES: helix-turn-helix transcriptional regulator [Streptomyces]AWL41505.1 XRE family transcriptional regulator [Streptomyces sp. SM18]SBU97757.1 Helix-turn-helix domain-containing protein [Streptomyces sp. OspMP-M45]SCD93018.1 Helix-turn-helix domain-containing protein [Streptomyces sp. DpondAA-D4]
MSEQSYEPGMGVLSTFGRQLKLFRVAAGLERPEFGAMTGYSASTIAAFEQARRIPSPKFIDQADELLNAGGVLKAGKDEVARAQYPAFFRDAARLEAEAVELHVYANHGVPGLLQTADYAQAVFAMWRPLLEEEVVEQRVAARMARHEIYSRRPRPTISFVIEESMLGRPLGGRRVLRGQLEQVLVIGQYRNVEIQVMPIGREDHAGMAGPFTLIETKEERRIAYVEAHKDSRLYTERKAVREFEEQYGVLRAQALTPRESLTLVEKYLGET